ncbi:MAG TPA: excinuclease ABC subunit UvrC [Candidatus Saccharimonadales bacterium]|jgi:excinuclease ABC subunit C|nr:excinuclease ABC subunit UvrC [Candidatus Saccharimonadales bacterium]
MKIDFSKKLASLPTGPGVYFHKDKDGNIIYIGKAANLRNRVRQYFQSSKTQNLKTRALVAEIADFDWIEVETEIDALFFEAELIRRYLPRYNILLRDDKSLIYIRISYSSNHPTVTITRRPLDDKAKYFGPYTSAVPIKRALQYLRKIFPYSTHEGLIPKRVCLQYHLGLCPGLEENKTSVIDYRKNLRRLMSYLAGDKQKLVKEIEQDMKNAAKNQDYEMAAKYRNQLNDLKSLANQIVFSDKENQEISKDQALAELMGILGFSKVPRRIEGYDISHMQGTNNVASMVVFINGVPDKKQYRRFKMIIPGNNDFKHMEEVISRRLSKSNVSKWGLPDLFLIDGGKGQLSSAIKARDASGNVVPMIGLAKRDEEIVVDNQGSKLILDSQKLDSLKAYVKQNENFSIILLPKSTPIIKLLQRIRDESHRFAVSYHTILKVKAQTRSIFNEINGIGPKTRKLLIRKYGTIEALSEVDEEELAGLIGAKRAKIIKLNF